MSTVLSVDEEANRLRRAAEARLEAAAQLTGPALPASVSLLQEALVYAVAAAQTDEPSASRAWKAVRRELPHIDGADAFFGGDPLILGARSPAELLEYRELATRAVRLTLQTSLPAKSAGQRRVPWLVVGATLAVLALGWLVLRDRNLAAGVAVTASSQHPNSSPPTSLVDGEHSPSFDFRTALDEKPWVQLDLGAQHSISRVVVHNRADGALEDILPLVIRISPDGERYRLVARTHQVFDDEHPWEVNVGKRARYVHIQSEAFARLALNEVEVYGR